MIGLLLIVVGLILMYAVHVHSTVVDLHTIGAILVVVGIIEGLAELLFFCYFCRRVRREWDDGGPWGP